MAKKETAAALAERLESLRSELLELEQVEEPTDEQAERAETVLTEFREAEERHRSAAAHESEVERIRSLAIEQPEVRVPGGPDLMVRNRRNPFEGVDLRSRVSSWGVSGSEVRTRALDAIEQAPEHLDDLGRERATELVETLPERHAIGVAEHILKTGSPEYHEAFRAYVEDPESNSMRAALSLLGSNGGYLVPFTFDPSVILTNVGSANPFRQLAATKTTTTNTWNGVTSAGVSGGWLAEGTEASDNSPTFAQTSITPEKAAAWVYGSYEVLSDSDFGSEFPRLLADAKDRLEEAAFATGDGSDKPYGAVTVANSVTAAGTASYAAADIYTLQQAVPARFRGPGSRNAFVGNLNVINLTRQMDTYGGGAFWANLGAGQPERLIGYPIHESTTMASALTTGSKILLFGDWSQYVVVDRVGVSVLYEPLVKGANQRPTGQAGWFAFWRVGAGLPVGTASNAMRVLTTG